MKKLQYLISVFCLFYGTCFLGDENTGHDIFTAFVLLVAAAFPIVHIMRDEDEEHDRQKRH